MKVWERVQEVRHRETKLKVNLFGPSGSGKTVFASTFPKPALIMKFEEGTNSVYNVAGIEDVPIYSTEEITQLISWKGITKYETIIVDTGTMLQDLVLREILGLDKIPEQKSWGDASQRQWGECSLKTKEILRSILDLSIQSHIVIITQEREFKSDADSEIAVPSIAGALTPAVSWWLNAACDCVVATYKRQKTKQVTTKIGGKLKTREVPTGGVEFCLRVGPNPVYSTKVRLPVGVEVPEYISNPTFEKLYSIVSQTSSLKKKVIGKKLNG